MQMLAVKTDPRQSKRKCKTYGMAVRENRSLPLTEIELLEIIPGRGLHIRTGKKAG
ncbi:MAG: hypothetical protein WCC08_22365 [Terrimicrobiaceae bacterium]